jgi:hypothetical protein
VSRLCAADAGHPRGLLHGKQDWMEFTISTVLAKKSNFGAS